MPAPSPPTPPLASPRGRARQCTQSYRRAVGSSPCDHAVRHRIRAAQVLHCKLWLAFGQPLLSEKATHSNSTVGASSGGRLSHAVSSHCQLQCGPSLPMYSGSHCIVLLSIPKLHRALPEQGSGFLERASLQAQDTRSKLGGIVLASAGAGGRRAGSSATRLCHVLRAGALQLNPSPLKRVPATPGVECQRRAAAAAAAV